MWTWRWLLPEPPSTRLGIGGTWTARPGGDILLKIADLIDKYRDELARIESMDMGKPLREAEGDVDDALHCYRYYAGLIKAPSRRLL